MDLHDLGEREAIGRLRTVLGGTDDLGGGEDDCAVLEMEGGWLLLASTDVLVGPTHMLPGAPPELLGSFAVEVAASDIAAMGGDPLGVLSGFAMPPFTDINWLEAFSAGMNSAARGLGVSIIGGDTKASSEPTVAITALGRVRVGRCLFRRGGRPGDVLILTGDLGGPALGFNAPRDEDDNLPLDALERIYGVRARVDAGKALTSTGHAHSCIDLSDGFAPALHQMLEASGSGAIVHWDSLPIVPGLEPLASGGAGDFEELALHWGGEYELLAAVDPLGLDEVLLALDGMGGGHVVGHLTSEREILLVRDGSPAPLSPHGFDHFKGV
jgi:thiamine-monophosphate kinase